VSGEVQGGCIRHAQVLCYKSEKGLSGGAESPGESDCNSETAQQFENGVSMNYLSAQRE